MFYFAYGSNLDPDQMRGLCPGHVVVGLASLPEHRLAFARYSPEWEGGVASLQPAHGHVVWGMLFDVDAPGMAALDRFEGFRTSGDPHNLYERELVTVDLARPDDGSPPRRVRAATYVARPSNPSPPSRRYLDLVLGGARHHRLPEEYVTALGSAAGS